MTIQLAILIRGKYLQKNYIYTEHRLPLSLFPKEYFVTALTQRLATALLEIRTRRDVGGRRWAPQMPAGTFEELEHLQI